MRLNRFQLALYMGFPILASFSSVLMILHYLTWLDGVVDESHPLSAALIYYEMAENLNFFDDTLHTYRVVVPAIAAAIGHGLGIGGEGVYGIIYGAINFVIFISACGIMFRISMLNQQNSAFQIILPAIILVLMPAYLQAMFFPLTDAGAFLAVAAITFSLFFKKLWLVYIACIAGVFAQEWVLFTVLLVPLINFFREDPWHQAYIPFLVAGVIYVFAVLLYTPGLDHHAIFSTEAWFAGLRDEDVELWPGTLWLFLAAFGPALVYIIYQVIRGRFQKLHLAVSAILLGLFIFLMIFNPDDATRLLFTAMPLLVFFTYTDDQFREVFKYIKDPSTMPVENRPGDDEASRESGIGGYTEINLN